MAHRDGPDFHYVNDGNAMDIRNFTDKDLFTFVGLEVQQQREKGYRQGQVLPNGANLLMSLISNHILKNYNRNNKEQNLSVRPFVCLSVCWSSIETTFPTFNVETNNFSRIPM